MAKDGFRRVAIKKEGYFPILYHWKTDTPLEEVVKEICAKWTLSKSEEYALQYLDTKIYITQENQKDILDGEILTITFNLELAAAKFLSDIEQPDMTIKRSALNQLAGIDGAGQADDPNFAKEFINRNGISALVHIVESNSEASDVVAQAMAGIQDLLEHGFATWDRSVNQKFVEKILLYANKTDPGTDQKIIQKALSLLDNVVTASVSNTWFILVMNKIGLQNLVHHLKSNNPKLHLSALSLCNSILKRMEHENRKKFSHELSNKGFTESLQKIVGKANLQATPLSSEMNHQLYVYQSFLLSLLVPRMNSKPDFGDQSLLTDLYDIYQMAFESAPMKDKERTAGKPDFRKLGFTNGAAPLIDFEECPPGILAHDVMMYFARKHHDQYIKLIHENFGRDEEYECPFGKCTKHLTKVLCEVLNVGASISEMSEDYQPIVFSTANVFEELFCVTTQLFNKTWKEMRATSQDFARVIGVVKDQVKRVLNEKPETIDKFKTKAFGLTYQQILRLMQQEAQERNILDSQTKPVMELRELIEPEIRELVRQQRLAQLVQGQCFSYFSNKGKSKEKYWFCCLSPNHRFLHYGDVESKDMQPSIDLLSNKLPLSDMNNLVTGKDCPHVKNWKGNKSYTHLAFSVMHGQEEHLNFIAPSPQILSVWTDALSTLSGNKMTSKEFHEDLDMLLNMEMKLLLLDLEDVRIPDRPPPIPREPDNYNFYYHDGNL